MDASSEARGAAITRIEGGLAVWLSEPTGWLSRVGLGLVILVAPLWLWGDPLDAYAPQSRYEVGLITRLGRLTAPVEEAWFLGDDFDYTAEARTVSDLRRFLWVPHNAHVVPLFRLWTYGWMQLAGTLDRLPRTFLAASLLTYGAATLLIGWLVGRESGRPALGLASMTVFGVSAVLEPTFRWYSAGQAIGAANCMLVMLLALQGWRRRAGWWRLAGAALAAVAAPLVWTSGLIAGPVGAAYLWADGRPHARRAALVPLLATVVGVGVVFGLAGRQVIAPKNFHGRALTEAANPVQGAMSSAQAIVEVVVLRNLGLAATTTFPQAAVLLALLATGWALSRGRRRPNALEAAGATMAALGCLLVYTARGYYPYEELRDLNWYHAAPQVGGILVAAGWWIGRRIGPPAQRGITTRRDLLIVVALLAAVLTLQAPRLRDNLIASAPPLTTSERKLMPIPSLRHIRAHYFRAERAARQRRSFARLDRAEARAQAEGWSRAAIRAAVGGPAGPRLPLGMFEDATFDPVALLALPEAGPTTAPPAAIRTAMLPLLTPDPEPRPPWLQPTDPWPPRHDPSG